jgi:hypothetical protein
MREPVRQLACLFLLGAAVGAAPVRAWAQPALIPPPSEAPPPAPNAPPDASAPPDIHAPPETSAPPAPPPPPEAPPVPPALQAVGQPEDAAVLEGPPQPPVARPRLTAAVGMGSSFDAVGFDDGNARAIPAFFTVLGIGDGLAGLDLLAFASQAAGRHGAQTPVDRLACDLFGVLRPGAPIRPNDRSYAARVLHGLGVELGLGFERDGIGAMSGTRFLIHTGTRVDLPLTPPREPTEVRLRLALRRGFGLYTPRIGGSSAGAIHVDDSAAEVYGALVVVF